MSDPTLAKIIRFAHAHGFSACVGAGACVEIVIPWVKYVGTECETGQDTFRVTTMSAARIVLGY